MTVNLNRGVWLVNELFSGVFKAFRRLWLLDHGKIAALLLPDLLLYKSLSQFELDDFHVLRTIKDTVRIS